MKSLKSMTLSVGLVVDDAIDMIENNDRHMEKCETARHAALRGAQ